MRWSILFHPRDWSVRIKFAVLLLSVALLPMLFITIQTNVAVRGNLVQSTRQQLLGHSQLMATEIDAYLATTNAQVNALALLPGLPAYIASANTQRTALAPELFTAIEGIASDQPGSVAYVVKLDGQTIVATDPTLLTQDFAADAFFKQALTGRTVLNPPNKLANGESVFYVATRIVDSFGQPVGVAVLRIPANALQQLFTSDKDVMGTGSYGVLIDEYGVRIANSLDPALNFTAVAPLSDAQQQARFGSASVAQVKPAAALATMVSTIKTPGAAPIQSVTAMDGDQGRSEVSAVRLTNAPWTYVAVQPDAAFVATPNALLTQDIYWAVVIGTAVIVLSLILSSSFTKPIFEIAAFLRRIRGGDYASRVRVTSGDEFGALAVDVNATVDRLVQLVQSSEQRDVMQAQIEQLLNEVSAVGEGDLRVEAEVTAGSLGSVADSFNYMIEELRRIIGTVQATTLEVTSSARQLRQSSEALAAGSAQQSTQIAEVSDAIVHINTSIQQVAEDATISSGVARTAVVNAQRGGDAVAKTIASMNRIRVNVQETAKKVKLLGERSQEIGNIVKLIEDIADKTDLLALNSAIQAEMAGEHGRGFAVLADEVRRLAERATNATKQIATIVKGIQNETQEAVAAMEESTREVVNGSELADEAGQALLAIDTVLAQLAERITSISGATAEQAQASTRIADTMQEIFQVTTQTHESTQEAVEKVTYLDQLASRLRTSVATFKLPEDQAA